MPHQDDLSVPRGVRGQRRFDSDAVARHSESIARFLGTGRYLAVQTVIVIVWISFNVIVLKSNKFDPYPFILLNLMFSTQAAYAAPLILLAQNRQTDRDRADVSNERAANARARADTDFLAREIAAIRISLESKVTRSDIEDVVSRLDEVLDRLPEQGAS